MKLDFDRWTTMSFSQEKIGQPRQKWLYHGEVMNDDAIPRQIFRFKE